MSEPVYNVLFVCTGNSARSILAEAIMNHLGRRNFRAFSAGSTPRGEVHPLALETLASKNYTTAALRSKSWDEFAGPEAPRMDFIFTLCDKAAGESCPLWPGHPITAHWGFADPAATTGTEAQQRAAFERAYREISQRLRIFLNLPLDKIDRMALAQQLTEIATQSPGSPS